MKKENKKKVVTLSAMAALLAVVLGMGGKTYAKYFAESNVPAQNATVAKFSLVANVDADKLFDDAYKGNTDSHATVDGSGEVVVQGTALVAPGAAGSLNIKLTGVSEVRAQLTVKAEVVDNKEVSLTDGTEKYYPIDWKIGDGTISKSITNKSLTELPAYTKTIEVGTDTFETVTVNWSWDFEHGTDPEDIKKYDDYDSALAYFAANGTLPTGSTYSAPSVNLGVKFTVTLTQLEA